jgi:pimeloyl-ACP methyl ester carboxylesterase
VSGLTERSVEAGGVRFFVREGGAGRPVLLLHGFPQTGDCWRAVGAHLAGSSRLIVPDLPGFGRSSAPRAYDAASIADMLVALVDTLGAPRATVVGHDWGGSLAFALALGHPDRVDRLVVSNAPFRKLDLRRGFHFLAFNVPVIPELAFRVAGDRLVAFMLRAGSARKEVFAGDAVRPYVEAYRDPAVVRAALSYYRTVTRRAIARGLRRRPAAGAVRRIEIPTLIVWGMRDPVLPPTILKSIEHDIPQARIVRLEDVGHFVPDEAPTEFAREIAAFLANG